jgi:hypothetical protein
MSLRFELGKKRSTHFGISPIQRRLLTLCLMLLAVTLLMRSAGDPQNWNWFFGMNGQPQDRVDARDEKNAVRVRPNAAPDAVPGKTDAVQLAQNDDDEDLADPERYFPGVFPGYLDSITDGAAFRAADEDAWYHLISILRLNDHERLEKASLGHHSYRQLSGQSSYFRGRVVTVAGAVRRSERIPIRKNNYGFEGTLYRLWVFSDDTTSPIVVYALELPAGFPIGEKVNQPIEATGFFFKRWTYQANKEDIPLVPLVISKTVRANESKVPRTRLHKPKPADAAADDLQQRFATPKDYMQEFWDGYKDDDWKLLIDGAPTSPPNTAGDPAAQFMAQLVMRIADFPLLDVRSWTRVDASPAEIAAQPDRFRGQFVRIEGTLASYEPVSLPADADRRFELESLVRCQLRAADGSPVVVYARSVPRRWTLAKTVGERASAVGLFIKLDPAIEGRQPPVLVADRIAWHPQSFFGDLGVDVGLWDRVAQRRRLTSAEHEPFYQMFNAISRVEPRKLAERAHRDHLERQAAAKADVPKKLDQPSNALFLHDLVEKPAEHTAALGVLSGTALRAELIRVDDEETRRRFGLDHYYQLDVSVRLDVPFNIPQAVKNGEEKKSLHRSDFPVVICVRELPKGFPEGARIHENVQVSAAFFKMWRVESGVPATDPSATPAVPMFVARSFQWLPTESAIREQGIAAVVTAALLIVAVLVAAVGLWLVNRRDRQIGHHLVEKTTALEPGTSLTNIPTVETPEKPNFEALAAAAQREEANHHEL